MLTASVHLLALSLTPCQQTTGVEQVAGPASRARVATLSSSMVSLSHCVGTLVTAACCVLCPLPRGSLHSATWEQFDAQHFQVIRIIFKVYLLSLIVIVTTECDKKK